MSDLQTYTPYSTETLPSYLMGFAAITERLGGAPASWKVKEVGDGNLNLVFIVDGPSSSIIVKQALPYVRLVGDSWPLPLYRAFFEYHALKRQAERDPGAVPELYHFDEVQALIVMEFIEPHSILRHKMINGEMVAGLADFLGKFCARTAFRGSELSMKSADKKADVGLFSGNVEIPAITEALVFTDPYFDAEMNHHTPELDPVVAKLRSDTVLKAQAQRMLMKFASNTETMVHGDLHSGSIMSTDTESRVIDPEFVQYAPMGFDIGMMTANFLMAYFSQPGHRGEDLERYQEWILSVITDCFASFEAEFKHLWQTERTGMLYPKTLFEDQQQSSEAACEGVLKDIWDDALGICGIEMHRRTLSLAHNADFETIENTAVRAALEARNLMMGAELVLNRDTIPNATGLVAMAQDFNKRDFL
ncbi:S-methyl-5-thioribose kinase [Cohaesibacter celericrescens]|uniref:S-methyl-5-thioribose kinase n=1 Tax=Cohaesibacter celericrescens TaxID=2067669 RepID=A0A2N5XRW3_9HYPH|nr:S-methyl-5-thioribose kinase [Cohaesibacter celericrescens]PLW77239.1 S-methyl-5-thioribose kinase [Cohaesibacter celericrescens]